MEIEVVSADPISGDVFRSSDGAHVGTIDVADFDRTRVALHLQVLVNGAWYVYKLEGIEELGEKNGIEAVVPGQN